MSSSGKSYEEVSRSKDNIARGIKKNDPVGTATFIVLRVADPFLQYAILGHGLANGLIKKLGGTILAPGPPVITNTMADRLGLSPYRSILLAMSVSSTIKQMFHLTAIMQERVSPQYGLAIGLGSAVADTINSLLFSTAQTSASVNGEQFPQTPLVVGSSFFALGLVLEWYSEVQRHAYKKDPANKGKVYQAGLFGLSRHVNYFGYMLWRTGFALAAGGWIWGAANAVLTTYQFSRSGIPVLEHYMRDRYGTQYDVYQKKVPYKFVPLLW
ncbi:hypothetical protein LTR62_005155 [Meristemomyces frigidus]|uniref:Steroid 5-alpha reductase C-terminal domain-containing protein n=1 Tax=Meristemomyces frigidus TaxID=1508187 RepID=A0AAN7TEH7_9PEZI|nr:hypothetical protein LTR62_005155 [Meristemomyces frigidus]